VRRLERRHAHTPVTIAHIQLDALAGGVAQFAQRGHRGLAEGIRPLRRVTQGERTRPEDEPSLAVAAEHPVQLERHGQTVRGGPGYAGRRDETAKGDFVLDRREDGCSLSITPTSLALCSTSQDVNL
jgi:hypothetical protein